MNTPTNLIKDKLNILDVVGAYVKLEKAGRNYKGKSPFNNEKTPSFFVSPDKGFFYCFSSGKGGDIFTFIQEIERIEFPEALKLLAERAGIELQNIQVNQQQQNERTRLFSLLDIATKWYEVNLRRDHKIVEYLLGRGLTKESIIKFRIGFARDSWRDIYDYLKSKKFTDSEIERAGLIVPKEGSGYYDRFRSRIMFPLMDGRGRVVGFSGRIFGADDRVAKYINSPEGPLFDKSRVLYGYHNAKSEMSKQGFCILVEGQFDVVLSQQSGHVNTVAISGTGLTDSHVEMIKRFTDTVYLALDSDNAGVKATRRSVITAYKHNMRVKIIMLQDGEDPADTIKRSAEAWDVALLEPHDYLDYRIRLAEKSDLSFEEKQTLVQKDLFEFVSFVPSATSQEHMLKKIALFLDVSLEAVKNDFAGYHPDQEFVQIQEKTPEKDSTYNESDVRKEILFLMHYIETHFQESFEKTPLLRELFLKNFAQDYESALEEISDEERDMSLFVVGEEKGDKGFSYFSETIFSLLKSVRLKQLEEMSEKIKEEIRKQELLNPTTIPTELMRKSNDIRQEIHNLKHE